MQPIYFLSKTDLLSSRSEATNAVGILAVVTSAVAAMADKVAMEEDLAVAAAGPIQAQPTLVRAPESYQP